jgi:tetratricopeptide (TPR) repeat protein
MSKPKASKDSKELHNLLRSDPQYYMRVVGERIQKNPCDSGAYFDRHLGWMRLGKPRQAIEDISKAIELDPKSVDFLSRGDVYRYLGEYENALVDYDRGEAMDPADWERDAFGLLHQADCHARLGDEHSALACCARLPEDFWTPGIHEAPAGGKADIAEALRLTAAQARGRRS